MLCRKSLLFTKLALKQTNKQKHNYNNNKLWLRSSPPQIFRVLSYSSFNSSNITWIEAIINSSHKLLSLEVSHLLTSNEVCSSVSLLPLPPHPLIAQYCLSSSIPFLASFACLTSLDTRVSHFIRFSHSLAPELPFQSPGMGKCHHLPSQLPVPGCQILPKKITKPGWLVPLQFRALKVSWACAAVWRYWFSSMIYRPLYSLYCQFQDFLCNFF